ncbi:O-methyltransferase family 2 [Penicillium malachiteum]|uniref:O-methyltransferase family 2 n=1 Tax=Penicillium malachiteum TaxID=1324776 RepID=A0AAD6MVC4_9EURO|nr:O-methyltransferase family 2 [Penicillium malachiteum]
MHQIEINNPCSRAGEISEAAWSLADRLATVHQTEPTFEHGLPPGPRSDLKDADNAAMAICLKLICMLDRFCDLLTEPSKHLSPESIGDFCARLGESSQDGREDCLSTYVARRHLSYLLPVRRYACSFNNATNLAVFSAAANMPERATAFSSAMAWHNRLPGFSAKYLIDHFPFNDVETTVVDSIYGGIAHISQAPASHNPSMKCVVQDFPEYVAQGMQILPTELESCVRFQAHDSDFFQEQPILKALIPALKRGAKIIVNDRVIPGFGKAHYLVERQLRYAIYHVFQSKDSYLSNCKLKLISIGDYDLDMFNLTNA